MKPIQFLERLSNDLTDLLNDNEDYNVLIETEEEPSMSLAILFVADDFGLEELANYVENYMLEVNVNYLHENFVFINKACFQHKSLKGLQNFYSEIIAKQPELIFNSKDFTKLSELALISLLKPNLKETLQNCLPLIRYFHLSSDQFFDKVFPHEKLLPTSLFKDLIQYFIIPDRPIKSSLILPPRFSTIITQRQAALIATWIDKLASSTIYNTQDNPYIFKLLLRGSRDGFRAKKFHDLCGEKSKTVVILKVQSTNEIIGGYNPIQWSKSGYGQTSESFLFSIDDNDLKNSVRSKVVNNSYALDYYSYYGPIFGGRDLALEDNFKDEKRCWCKKRYYDRAIRKVDDAFSVEDYEIFQVVPKNNNVNNNYYLSNNNDSNDISSLDDE
ncbi:4709_t:CDS:2 [Entrophospora sp. SA101]|nr:4709_t:CDS:2 [Entrophospora sp. SA101]